MNKKAFAVLFAALTFVVGVALARVKLAEWRTPPELPQVSLGQYKLSGPYIHENLTVFLIHGPDQEKARLYTPLPDALERNLVTVFETGDVNELAIQNISNSDEVLVQAGDIVKGGQQDRVLAVDLILPTNSERISIDAFCVEQSRWQQRGVEVADHFSSAEGMLATKELKLATRHDQSQGRVWNEVNAAQGKLSDGLSKSVRSSVSESSLQLTLEDAEVQKSVEAYVKQLAPSIEQKGDVLGVVFVINNKLSSADIYATTTMFRRFSNRLLKTAAIESIAELRTTATDAKISQVTVSNLLADAEQGIESTNDVTNRTRLVKREGKAGIFFETRDMASSGAWVHRSFLSR